MRSLITGTIIGHLGTFLSLKEKVNNPFHSLWSFEDYLEASGVRIEPEEIKGNMVQPDYKDIVKKYKASLKNNARIWFRMYIEKRVWDLHSAGGWKTVKSKFLTYFNPIGSTKEQQIKAWKKWYGNLMKRN